MEDSDRPQDTQTLKEEKLEEGWSERKPRQKKNCAWKGANIGEKESPLFYKKVTDNAHLGCNSLSQDQICCSRIKNWFISIFI